MTIQVPVPDYAAAREAMVDSQLRPQGVTDPGVLAAMASIAREAFVPAEVRPLAYSDRALALGGGRFLAPCPVTGQLLTQMAPASGESALVVGAATGYSSAILAHIGLKVVALDSDVDLAEAATALGVQAARGPLEAGAPQFEPYDLILIDGSVEYIPDALVGQLAEGGRLGVPLVEHGICRLTIGRKAGEAFGYFSVSDAPVPALPGFRRPRTFTF